MIENYKAVPLAVILKTCKDLHNAYVAYRRALKAGRTKAAERLKSDIRYLEGWLIDAVPEWTDYSGERFILECRKQAEEDSCDA